MSDVKIVITLLCKHIELCTGLEIKPEYFNIFKQNNESTEATKCFWLTLNKLSHIAVKNLQPAINFQHYDIVKSTKLYFGFLQYTGFIFYSLSENTNNLCELLLALAWLIGKQSVLETAVRFNLVDSILSGNSAYIEDPVESKILKHQIPSDVLTQIDAIIHKSCMISHNLKEISGLISDKIKATTKVHTASLNICDLVHLNVPEMAIIKRYVCNDEKYSKVDEKSIEELNRLGMLLDVHSRFLKKENIFFDWMATVLEEYKKQIDPESEKNFEELSTFVCIIRHLTKKKIVSIKNGDGSNDRNISKTQIMSRFLKSREKEIDVQNWDKELLEEINKEESKVKIKMEILEKELKIILKTFPDCIQV